MRLATFLGSALLLLILLPAAFAVVNTTGTITLENNNGDINAGVSPGNSISVTFNEPDTEESSGAGGGGGGGAGEDNVCFETPPSTSHLYDNIEAGKTYKLNALSQDFYIRKLNFTLNKSREDGATFTLTHVLHIGCEVIPAVSDDLEALAYERIDYVGVHPDDIKDVQMELLVPLEAIDDAGASETDVKLYRYHQSNWEEVTTIYEEKGALTARYRVESPGLSMFAITVPKRVPATTSQGGSQEEDSSSSSGDQQITGQTTGQTASNSQGGDNSEPTNQGEERDTTTAKKPVNIPWMSIIIVLVIGGAIGVYYYIDKERKKEISAVNAAAVKPDVHEPLIGISNISEDALLDPVEQLRKYVDKELRQGFHRDEIASQLEESGWPLGVINEVLDTFSTAYLRQRGMETPHDDHEKLLRFLAEKLSLGYSRKVIRESLVKSGWESKKITALFKEISGGDATTKLQAYITAELDGGKSKEQIKAALLAAGWKEDIVNKELE